MAGTITTADQLWEAGDIGRCELVRGELVMMLPPGGEHARLGGRLTFEIGAFANARGLGSVLTEAGFVLTRDPDTVRAPDVAFMRAGRDISTGYIDGAPDLAVEVLSPNDRKSEVRQETAEWLAAGTRQVWIVDPATRTVEVHEPNHSPRTLEANDTLDGGEVLPAFELPITQLWT